MINSINSAPQALPAKELTAEQKRLKTSCQEFESFFTSYVLKSMRNSVPRAEEPEQSREIYEGMLDDTLSKELSQGRGLGLGELLYERLAPLVKTSPVQSSAQAYGKQATEPTVPAEGAKKGLSVR